MKKKKKNNEQKNKITIFIIVIAILILLIILGIYLQKSNDDIEKNFNKEGYITEDDSAFYKKITTNNTLDDYYDALSKGEDSAYEEYYFSKESNDFIELKLNHQDKVSTSLTITSELKSDVVNYSFELSYKDAYMLLEGNSLEAYECKEIIRKNISDNTLTTYCNSLKSEIEIFLQRRTELLKNKKIRELVNSPIKEINEK